MGAFERILFVDDPPFWGGGQRMLILLLKAFADRTRVLIRPCRHADPEGCFPAEALYRIPFPDYPAALSTRWQRLRLLLPSLAAAWRIGRIARRHRAEAIVVNSFYAMIPVWLLTRVMRRPVVWICHTADYPDHPLMKQLFAPVRLAVACSRFVYETSLADLPPARKTVVFNAIETQALPEGNNDWRRELGWQDRWVLGYVGRLVPCKNVDRLIEAFCRFRREAGRPVGLLIVGEGPERARLKGLAVQHGAEGDIHFCGHVQDAARLMPALDALCQVYAREAFGMTLLEAQQAGIPTLGVAGGGNAEVIEDGVTGVLIPAATVEEIQNGLRRLAAMAPGGAITQTARQRLQERFSLPVYRESIRRAIDSLAVNSGAPQSAR